MPDGPERERLIKSIRRAEKASDLEVLGGSPQYSLRFKPVRQHSA
jgi:hypothetical protein